MAERTEYMREKIAGIKELAGLLQDMGRNDEALIHIGIRLSHHIGYIEDTIYGPQAVSNLERLRDEILSSM